MIFNSEIKQHCMQCRVLNDQAKANWRWMGKKNPQDAQDDVIKLFDLFDARFWGWKGI